jgi:RNA polymerase sigma factor (TIGR02999 family)
VIKSADNNNSLAGNSVTRLLEDWSGGDESALERLTPFVYDELRRLAAHYLNNERADHTLQATALVHEAYLQLLELKHISWQNRAHFIGVTANLMRKILVDHARRRNAGKRGGGERKMSLHNAENFLCGGDLDMVELDTVLETFSRDFPRHGKVVELKFFGGLTIDEIVNVLSVNGEKIAATTVERDWRFARAWLHDELRNK